MIASRTGQLLPNQGADAQRVRVRQVLPHVMIEQAAEDIALVLAEQAVGLKGPAELLDDQAREHLLEALGGRLDVLGTVGDDRGVGQAGHRQQDRGEDAVHGVLHSASGSTQGGRSLRSPPFCE
jgi:hypothetical protein